MLSVILNIVTLTIVAALFILFFSLYKKRKNKSDTAFEVGLELLKDPLVVSRAYFTERKKGSTGSFVGNFPWDEKEWLYGYPLSQAWGSRVA